MKNKHGFTLIELLAVIVVLAIIALIAVPKVTEVINNAEKGAAERSGESYIRQVETTVATERMKGNKLSGTYKINSEGNLEGDGLSEPLVIEMSGNKPTSGTIVISNGDVVSDGTSLTIGDYTVTYSDGKCSATEADGETVTKTYTNGEVVYFNVTSGTKCTSSEAVSTTETKKGCMKFYAFNDDGGTTVNLLLDHNTTATVAWNSDGSNASGPREVLTQLKTDTSSWVGTETPANYTMDQSTQDSGAKYTIDYSSYKARLITAQEIATITGNTGWDEKLSTSDYYYVHSNTQTEYKGEAGTNKYAWLFDNTDGCTTYGCNVADSSTYGYWTASSCAFSSYFAWDVYYDGSVSNFTVVSDNYNGVRPVITVLKSKLS